MLKRTKYIALICLIVISPIWFILHTNSGNYLDKFIISDEYSITVADDIEVVPNDPVSKSWFGHTALKLKNPHVLSPKRLRSTATLPTVGKYIVISTGDDISVAMDILIDESRVYKNIPYFITPKSVEIYVVTKPNVLTRRRVASITNLAIQ